MPRPRSKGEKPTWQLSELMYFLSKTLCSLRRELEEDTPGDSPFFLLLFALELHLVNYISSVRNSATGAVSSTLNAIVVNHSLNSLVFSLVISVRPRCRATKEVCSFLFCWLQLDVWFMAFCKGKQWNRENFVANEELLHGWWMHRSSFGISEISNFAAKNRNVKLVESLHFYGERTGTCTALPHLVRHWHDPSIGPLCLRRFYHY